ncbi:hypothetical protein KP509_10G055800 [Ceratopteris richardii]|uniref:PPPDE domain-containing protein n=1 Tax=Ceratopteris richardii TaxID=49495 RepID=A0A8T2U230_CERRI|nr:hypothetical protein KP509_10G055800 [Ceratopteris richardii]
MARMLLAAVMEDMEEERAMIQEPLKLNIYDLTCMNKCMYWVGLGVYHSAIEAYGREYAYGAHDYPTSGIFEVEPRQCPGFKFRKSITVGFVWMGAEKFREFVEQLAAEYTGNSYNLLLKNCNHFCDDVCIRVVNEHIPAWVNRLAKIGLMFSCFLPRALQNDGIDVFDYQSYQSETDHAEDEINNLANALTMIAPRKRQLVTLSSLLCSSKSRIFLWDYGVENASTAPSREKFKEL